MSRLIIWQLRYQQLYNKFFTDSNKMFFKTFNLLIILYNLFVIRCDSKQHMTVGIMPKKEECYHQILEYGETIAVYYQVLDSSSEYSKLDIDFRLVQPDGLHVVIEHRNGENFHEYAGGKILPGAYKFCFDNKFSTFSTKLVYFEVDVVSQKNENRDTNEKFDEDKELELAKYQVTAGEIVTKLFYMKEKMLKAANLQTHMTLSHGRDMNLLDKNTRRIDNTSLVLFVLIVLAGYLQAYMIKQMFTVKV